MPGVQVLETGQEPVFYPMAREVLFQRACSSSWKRRAVGGAGRWGCQPGPAPTLLFGESVLSLPWQDERQCAEGAQRKDCAVPKLLDANIAIVIQLCFG